VEEKTSRAFADWLLHSYMSDDENETHDDDDDDKDSVFEIRAKKRPRSDSASVGKNN